MRKTLLSYISRSENLGKPHPILSEESLVGPWKSLWDSDPLGRAVQKGGQCRAESCLSLFRCTRGNGLLIIALEPK